MKNKLFRISFIIILVIISILIGGDIGLDKAPATDTIFPGLFYMIYGAGIGFLCGAVLSTIFWILTNTQASINKKIVAVVIGSILLGSIYFSFRRKPVNCNQVQESELQSLVAFEEKTLVHFQNSEYYNTYLKNRAIETTYYKNGSGPIVSWDGPDGVHYSGIFRHDVLRYVEVDWQDEEIVLEPTAREILDCFGQPDFFHIPAGEVNKLVLWYLDEGLIVSSVDLKRATMFRPTISNDLIMSNMIIVAPETVEVIAENIDYQSLFGPLKERGSNVLDYMDYIHPWPGSLEDVAENQQSH